jgi:ABC-type nitrate/sulfonate/bicarbonate transport system substrate-binding protein
MLLVRLNYRKKTRHRMAVFAVLVALFVACTRPTATRELVIAHPEALAAVPLSLAAESLLAGEKIRLKPYTDHALAVAEFLRGESDLLFTGTTLGAMQAEKGVKLWRTLVWGTASIVLKPGAKTSAQPALAQLNGKRVALPFRGSPNDVQFRRLIETQQSKPIIEYQQHTQAAASLLAGQIDAAILPEPLASKLIAEHRLTRLAELSALEEGILRTDAPAPMVSFFVGPQLSEAKLQRLPELERMLIAILKRIEKEPRAVARLFASRYQVTNEVLQEALRYTHFALPEAATARKRTVAFLRAAGISEPGAAFFMP